MQYPCPERTDLAEIRALNAEFLSVCSREQSGDPVSRQLARLTYPERQSLAAVPFLLFSVAEDDVSLWNRLFDRDSDLLDEPTAPEWVPITTAAIAFLWHLAKRAPHDVRLFAACSSTWCQRLAEHRLMCVTEGAVAAGIRPKPRFEDRPDTWNMLIDACRTADPALLGVGQMMAMQRLLLQPWPVEPDLMAACRIEPVSRRVSE